MENNNPFNTGYYREDELVNFGFKSVGKNVMISKSCTIVGLENISIGNNVRIDSQCILTAITPGFIEINNYIHIASQCILAGGGGIILDNFSNVSYGGKLFSMSDDYSGEYLMGPTVPKEYTCVDKRVIHFKEHTITGAGCIVFPGVILGEGVAVGSNSLIIKSLAPWGVYIGSPVRRLRDRSKNMLQFVDKLIEQ
jgi:galactoside O-acetyltransferase